MANKHVKRWGTTSQNNKILEFFIAKIMESRMLVRVVDKPEKYLFMFCLQVHYPNLFALLMVGI